MTSVTKAQKDHQEHLEQISAWEGAKDEALNDENVDAWGEANMQLAKLHALTQSKLDAVTAAQENEHRRLANAFADSVGAEVAPQGAQLADDLEGVKVAIRKLTESGPRFNSTVRFLSQAATEHQSTDRVRVAANGAFIDGRLLRVEEASVLGEIAAAVATVADAFGNRGWADELRNVKRSAPHFNPVFVEDAPKEDAA